MWKSYIEPVWQGEIIENETLMFIENEDGTCDEAPLLYNPTEVISVKNSGLDIEYKRGVDYEVTETGIKRLSDKIFAWKYDKYYLSEKIEDASMEKFDGNFLYFGEKTTFTATQVAVTYKHKPSNFLFVPQKEEGKLPIVRKKLANSEPLKIVCFGDSISARSNVSGADFINVPPYMPGWDLLAAMGLEQKYGSKCEVINTAVGGKDAQWGVEEVKERVCKYNPDLVFLGFGMNNATTSPAEYKRLTKKTIDIIKEDCPDAEIVLISTMLPNSLLKNFWGNQQYFEHELIRLATNCDYLTVAPMTTMHRALLQRKRYFDMTGNNVNHPNDFLARVYAQTILNVI